jgi:hypothetical protein
VLLDGTLLILSLIVFSTSSLCEPCLNSVHGLCFSSLSRLPLSPLYLTLMFILFRPFKISSFHLHPRVVCFTYFSLGRIIFFVTCEFLTPSFAYFCLLLPLPFPSLDHTLVIMLCLLSKISNLLSQSESSVLLILPLAISSSLSHVSLDMTPFFVVIMPLTLLYLHLFSYNLVCYRL